MRMMLCLSRKLTPTCRARAEFDVWSHHPYTSGGPTHEAFGRDDVSLGDLPEMRAVLDAAIRHRKIVSRRRVRFWVTEFSWDTSPPDPEGVPLALHRRWVSEALYQMWRSRVSLVVWLQIRDAAHRRSPFQAGLYFASGRPKPALQAFRFAFVAYTRGRRVYTWGRTPFGAPGRIAVEQRAGRRWRRLGTVSTGPHGVFERTFARRGRGDLRAQVVASGETSRAFSLTRPRDRFVYPFGSWHP
jgi:hypothetical protein